MTAIPMSPADTTGAGTLFDQVMIERAMSVVVVTRRVDEDTAAQVLVDVADEADIPVRLAADQILDALQASDDRDGITQDTLAQALEAVRSVQFPRVTIH